MKKEWLSKLRPVGLIALFSLILILPQWLSRGVLYGSDSIFHYNRFYEAAMQIKNWNFSYFISVYGFQQSGRIVNAVYGPFFAYFQGLLILLGKTWFGYQLLSRFVLGLVAGLSMYSLLKSAKVREEISLPIALFYLTTFSIQYWTLRQGFTSWGAAVMPYCFIPAIRFTFYREIHPLRLAVSVALIFQIHLLSALFLVLMYLPFFAYGFFKSHQKLRLIGQGLLSVGLSLILTANVWLALLFLKQDNRLLDPFINELMANNAINTGSSYWITTPFPLIFFFIGEIVYLLWRWQAMAKWKKILHTVYLGFIFLSTSFFPWSWLITHKVKFAQLIQFPFRFFIPATILLLLIGGMTLNRFVNWRKLSCLALSLMVLVGAIQTMQHDLKLMQAARDNHYVLQPSRHVHLSGSYEDQYQANFDRNLKNLLDRIQKSTPDYIPVYASIKGYNTYDAYANQIIYPKGFTKQVLDDGGLQLTWTSKGSQENLPIVVYKRTNLTLNGKQLAAQDYNLSTFGAPRVTSQVGVNKLTVSFTVPAFFTVALWLTIVAWLGLAAFWLSYRLAGRDFQVLLSD